MKTLIVLIALWCGAARANQEIASTIKYLSPTIDQKVTYRYAIIIDRYSRRYEVDWKIAVAIFQQESRFDIKAVNYLSRDFGIGQINYRNIMKRDIDLGKLLSNADYAIGETFKILHELKVAYHREKYWYSRYHSFTPSLRRIYREKYLAKWLAAIDRFLNERQELTRENKGVWDWVSPRAPRSMQAIIRRYRLFS